MMKTALKQKLAAILLAASALFGAAAQATAQPLATDPAILKLVDKKSYEPGGKNHLFGGARGNVRERHGNLGIIASSSMRAGNIETEYVSFGGHYGYETRFRSHPWQDHSPFDHSAVRNGGNKGAAAADGYGAANYVYSISGSMVHPADGYDGAAGGGYPAPTGARDVYSYSVSGTASRSRLVEPEKAPCFAGACQPSVEPGLGAEKRREQTENALPDGMRAEADAAAAARGVAQAERLLRDYHIDGVKLGFSYDDLIKMGYGMPPEALAVAKGASLTRKHPDEYVQAVSQGLNRLERYESEQGQKLIESGTREIDLIFRPFDPALSWKGNTANKTAAALRGFNHIANYAGDASGINPLFGAAWNTVVPDDVSQSIGNQIGQVKNDMNNWAGSDAEKQAYVALALAGTETAANVVPGRFGKGKIPHAGKGRSPHGDIPHGGSGSPHGGNPHPNRGSPHGENHSKPHGSNPHSSGNPHGNPSASLHPGHSGGHTALPNRRPGIPHTHGGHYGSRPSAGHGSHNGGNPSGNYNGTVSIHNDGSGGSFNGDGAGNGGKGGDGKGTPPPPPDIRFNPDLERHLANVDGVDRNGIKGGHNQDNFMKELERLAALDPHGKMTVEDLISRKELSDIDGISHIYYRVPIYNHKKEVVGYKDIKIPKTVYDPAKISDEQMVEMGKQAALKKYEETMRMNKQEFSSEFNGIDFYGYMDYIKDDFGIKQNTGVIKHVFPTKK
ncbi:MafB family polymorphic toxin [Neisseria sp. KEM232]|uniref:MafB family polymorphic toxin n=1 Tax=Neisseria sp. KEM232 TaxID=655307 RepID=UPI0018E036FF|nr:MafB family polymorphic toxin [Neisseria sp. KEM232]